MGKKIVISCVDLGQRVTGYELTKVKDMILKAAIEEAQRRDAQAVEAFGGRLAET